MRRIRNANGDSLINLIESSGSKLGDISERTRDAVLTLAQSDLQSDITFLSSVFGPSHPTICFSPLIPCFLYTNSRRSPLFKYVHCAHSCIAKHRTNSISAAWCWPFFLVMFYILIKTKPRTKCTWHVHALELHISATPCPQSTY